MAHGFENEPYWKPDGHDECDAPQNDLGTLGMSASWSFFEHDPEMGFGVGDFQKRPTLTFSLTQCGHCELLVSRAHNRFKPTASGQAHPQNSHRNRGRLCGQPSQLQRILRAADKGGTWYPRGHHAGPA